jgi:hypothetical protein
MKKHKTPSGGVARISKAYKKSTNHSIIILTFVPENVSLKSMRMMYDENYWHGLASSRRLENKALKARIVEITEGREKWKSKAMQYQEENKVLKKSMVTLKKTFIRSKSYQTG